MSAEEYIAIRVTELCEQNGMTKYRLSQITGITQTTLKKIMNKETIPTIYSLEKICGAFRISLSQFFAGCDVYEVLPHNQRELLEIWDTLDSREQDIVLTVARGLKR